METPSDAIVALDALGRAAYGARRNVAKARDRGAEYLTTIDGWRAVAIAAVLVCHRQSELFGSKGLWPNRTLVHVADEGGHGVDLFFAISGLLITRRLLAQARERTTPSLRSFYVKRAFRILPAVFTYLTLAWSLALAGLWAPTREDLIASVFFYRNYVHGHLLTEHLWSLAVEEHFYLVWPLFFLALLKWGDKKIRIWPIAVVALGVAAWRFAYFADRSASLALTFRTDVRFDALLWGCVAAIAYDVPAVRSAISKWLSASVFFVVVIGYALSGELAFALSTWLKALLGPLLLLGTMQHTSWMVSRFLESRPVRFVGHLSYSLYLFQQALVDLTPNLNLGIISFFVGCLALAALCHYVVEKPLVRLGHRVSARVLSGGAVKVNAPPRELATAGVVVAAFAVTFSLCLRTTRAQPSAPDTDEVDLFADADFHGAKTTLHPGTHGPSELGPVGNDEVSSIIVGRRVRARVCRDALPDGTRAGCSDLAPGTLLNYVGDGQNDKISAVDVTLR